MEQFVKFKEAYVSSALNQKFNGLLSSGVYWGFEVEPGDGLQLLITPGPDFGVSVAVVERDGYSITVSADENIEVPVAGSGTWYVVIDALYTLGQAGYQQIKLTGSPAEHHIKLAQIVVPPDTTQITADMIDGEQRDTGNPILAISNLQALVMSLTTENIDMRDRLLNIEEFLKQTTAFDPDVMYPTT